jgi:hypothetical protein
MALADADKLLRTEQGLTSPDYDLHHYDWAGGWLKQPDDPDQDSKTSHVAVFHFWAADQSRRTELLDLLLSASDSFLGLAQSFAVLKEVRNRSMATLWLR